MADQDPKYDVEDLYGKSGCDDALHVLYEYLDGELTSERRLAIRRHLHDCEPCLHAFDFEAELKVVVAKSCRDQVPDLLRAKVAAAILEASKTSGSAGSIPEDHGDRGGKSPGLGST